MNSPDINRLWDGTDLRTPGTNRRKEENRRTSTERRCDTRDETQQHKRNLRNWVRSLTHSRLGVDRRKMIDQRATVNRRSPNPRSMLTKEELADLLK